MTIVHIITRMIVGGAQENTLLTCRGLKELGHRVILLTGPSRGPEGSLLEDMNRTGCEIREIPSLLRNPNPFADIHAYRAIGRQLADIKPQVVHTHSSKAGILGRKAAWKQRVGAVIHTIHGLPFHPYQSSLVNQAWINLERYAAHRCHAIICVAKAMRSQALTAGVGRPEQYEIVYSGMQIEQYLRSSANADGRARLGIEKDAIVIGTVARLQPLKGHDDLLKIAGDLLDHNPRIHFLWIGDGVFRPRLQEEIDRRNWSRRFTLAGLVPPQSVGEMLSAMDIMAHPSYREGLPRAVVQGMLAELPAVVYDCDGAAEICRSGSTGILVETGNVPALKSALRQLADNAAQRRQFGAAGKKLAAELFDWRIMVNQLDRLYRKVCDKNAN